MPTTTLPQVIRTGRSSVSSGDWQGFLQALNPLAQWENKFAIWRGHIQHFRQSEQDHFFPHLDDASIRHIHRGWLCDLISDGDRLAIELLTEHSEAEDRLKFLNLCLENLVSTLETWHLAQDVLEDKKASA